MGGGGVVAEGSAPINKHSLPPTPSALTFVVTGRQGRQGHAGIADQFKDMRHGATPSDGQTNKGPW